jgi:hypothetical protein
VKTGPRWISAPPESLHTRPNTEAPLQDEPITECGSRPSGFSAFSSSKSVAPGWQITWRPLLIGGFAMRIVLMMMTSRS